MFVAILGSRRACKATSPERANAETPVTFRDFGPPRRCPWAESVAPQGRDRRRPRNPNKRRRPAIMGAGVGPSLSGAAHATAPPARRAMTGDLERPGAGLPADIHDQSSTMLL